VKEGMRDGHAGYTALLSVAGNSARTRIDDLRRGIYPPHKISDLINDSLPLLGSHDLRKMTFPKETRIHTRGWYDLGPRNN
jgi:hypothetical protein